MAMGLKDPQSQRRIGESILEKIGNTPLIQLRRVTAGLRDVEIYAKAEWFNPGGSVKDRPAYRMIQEGLKSGKLVKGKTILDSSSGNTAIAYAMIGAALGYPVEMVMPENVSDERKKILQAFGAKLTMSSPMEGSDGAILMAKKILKSNPEKYFMPDQYNNEFNPVAHYETTGVEIWEQTEGGVTHFLAGIGTGGTVMGTSRRLKEFNPAIKCFAVEPEDSFHGLEGMKHMASSIKPGIYDEKKLDGVIPANTEKAYEMTRRLAREEGIFVGQSSGAAMVSALELAKKAGKGVIVTVFPDGGDKYLSTRVWE